MGYYTGPKVKTPTLIGRLLGRQTTYDYELNPRFLDNYRVQKHFDSIPVRLVGDEPHPHEVVDLLMSELEQITADGIPVGKNGTVVQPNDISLQLVKSTST